MKLIFPNCHITIDDNSPEAQKIKEGHNYSLNEKGELRIDEVGKNIKTKWQAINATKKATTLEELKKILIEFLSNN